MRRCITFISGCMLFGGTVALSQSPLEEYNKFRQQILSDYDNFKSRILEHYGDFLNGEWHEFEPLWEEESPYTQPKPKALPETPATPEPEPEPAAAKLPTPKLSDSSLSGVLAPTPHGDLATPNRADFPSQHIKIDIPGKTGGSSMPNINTPSPAGAALALADVKGKSNYVLSVLRLPDPGFAFGDFPGQIAVPKPGEAGIINVDMSKYRMSPEELQRAAEESGYATEDTFKEPQGQNNFKFDFYDMEAFIPEIEFNITNKLSGPEETGAHWKKMAEQEGGVETARQLFGLAQQLGLNGYLTYRLAEAYVNQKFKNSDQGAKTSAVHFLLSNMGYDARLIKLNDMFTIMMPFDQKVVFATMSQTIDGRKYTVLFPDGYEPPRGQSMRLMTCNLPSNSLGKTSDLRLTGLSLPMRAKPFTLTNGTLTVTGEVNENIQKLLHHYPQMPTGDFASSWVDSRLRENIVDQLKSQLSGKTGQEAVNSLMALCHKGFNYSTDQDFHGFEKPYFFEENFIYDKNDCEDRAIFFSYLLWNALGLPCQLVQYPGHESATVAVSEEIPGYFYNTDGIKFYSADPTYIGSSVGMVMKAFRNASPTIDKEYK